MLWMFIFLVHVAAFLILKNDESKKKDLDDRVTRPFVPVAPNRFPECENQVGYYDPDREERAKIAKRNRKAVDEIDRAFKTVCVLKKLKKM